MTPGRPRRALRSWLRIAGALVGGLVALLGVLYLAARHPVPRGTPGPQAELLASSMVASVNGLAWVGTGALRWTFPGGRQHLWDRARMYDRMRHGEDVVLVDLTSRQGRAWHHGVELTGEARRRAVAGGYAAWINDSFWLNPLVKIYDDGVTRSLVTDAHGGHALLVSYASGGLTPGDRYLWIPGANDRPRAWRMWVSALPIPGLEMTWEGWTRLSTGAWVSTVHRGMGLTMRVRDVAGARTLGELEQGPDPFADISQP